MCTRLKISWMSPRPFSTVIAETNGLAKRFNQTILTKMQCALAQSMVPINYWDEAARYSSMLINILPSSALLWKSPVHVHSPHQSKLGECSKPLLFLGYEPYSDAGRFINPSKRQVTSLPTPNGTGPALAHLRHPTVLVPLVSCDPKARRGSSQTNRAGANDSDPAGSHDPSPMPKISQTPEPTCQTIPTIVTDNHPPWNRAKKGICLCTLL